MEEYDNKKPNRFLGPIIIVCVVLLALYLVRNKDLFKSQPVSLPNEDNKEVVKNQSAFTTQEEWEAMRNTTIELLNEVNALRNEVEGLKNEVKQLKDNRSASSLKQPTTSINSAKPTEQQSSTIFDPNAVTLASYTHDWVEYDASVSLKNNTSRRITKVTGRMIYYDMSGNMLDYRDFTKAVDIEPGMVKSITLPGYGYKDSYAYYQSQVRAGMSDRKYKVGFQLKSYK